MNQDTNGDSTDIPGADGMEFLILFGMLASMDYALTQSHDLIFAAATARVQKLMRSRLDQLDWQKLGKPPSIPPAIQTKANEDKV